MVGTAVSADDEELPYYVKYGVLVGAYADVFGAQIEPQLSPDDRARLSNLANTNAEWEISENARYEAEIADYCASLGGKSDRLLATEYDQIAARSNERRAQRYKRAIDSLSASGKQIVDDFVEQKISAHTRFSAPTSASLNDAELEDLVFVIKNECHKVMTGEYTSEYEAAKERARMDAERDLQKKLARRTK